MSKLLCGFASVVMVGIVLIGCGPSGDGKPKSSSEGDGKPKTSSEGDGKEAEKLFQVMEQKILKCKTFQTQVETSVTGTQSDNNWKGVVAVAPGDKVRLTLEPVEAKPNRVILLGMLSDGNKWQTFGSIAFEVEKPARLGQIALASITRPGVQEGFRESIHLANNEQPLDFDINKYYPVSDFKSGKKETISGVEAQAIEYSIKPPKISSWVAPLSVTLWVDEKTGLPVKRMVTGKWAEKPFTVTETYTKTVLDEKIDDKQFKLM
jgi:hypothetical protein